MTVSIGYTGDTGKATATAGTAIVVLIPPRRNTKTRIFSLRYTAAGTAHLLTVLRPLARTTVYAAAAAAQLVVVLKIDPGTLLRTSRPVAANDYLVFEGPTPATGYYSYILAKVASVAAGTVAGTLNVTLTANVPAGGIALGAVCWLMGVTTDAHPQFNLPASATTLLSDPAIGLVGAQGRYEPLVLSADNVTAAGTLENAAVGYVNEATYGGTLLPGQRPEGEEVPPADDGEAHLSTVLALEPDVLRAMRTALQAPRSDEEDPNHAAAAYLFEEETGLSQGQYCPDPEDPEAWAREIYGDSWPGSEEEAGTEEPNELAPA